MTGHLNHEIVRVHMRAHRGNCFERCLGGCVAAGGGGTCGIS